MTVFGFQRSAQLRPAGPHSATEKRQRYASRIQCPIPTLVGRLTIVSPNRRGLVLLPTHDKDRTVGALVDEWASLADLCSDLSEDEWNASTPVPGWSVKDNLTHIIGTEKMLAGEDMPNIELGEPAHVLNEIGRANELWVASMRPLAGAEVLDEFRSITSARAETLRAMSQEAWDEPSWTPAGEATYGRFMVIRVYDCWTHEQDMRIALGRPGHLESEAAAISLDEVTTALGYIVAKRGEAPVGSRIEFDLGGAGLDRKILVSVDERATVVDSFGDDPVTARLSMPFELFMRLTAGRRRAKDAIEDGVLELSGDTAVGRRIATHLSFTV